MVATILEQLMRPATDRMPAEFAKNLLGIRADGQLLRRLEELRRKANEGQLSSEEQAEYREMVEAIDILSLFQQKASQVLQSLSE